MANDDTIRLVDAGSHNIKWLVEGNKIMGAWFHSKYYTVADIYRSPHLHDLYHKACKELACPDGT